MSPRSLARLALVVTLAACALVVSALATGWMSSAHAYGLAGVLIFTTSTTALIVAALDTPRD